MSTNINSSNTSSCSLQIARKTIIEKIKKNYENLLQIAPKDYTFKYVEICISQLENLVIIGCDYNTFQNKSNETKNLINNHINHILVVNKTRLISNEILMYAREQDRRKQQKHHYDLVEKFDDSLWSFL